MIWWSSSLNLGSKKISPDDDDDVDDDDLMIWWSNDLMMMIWWSDIHLVVTVNTTASLSPFLFFATMLTIYEVPAEKIDIS